MSDFAPFVQAVLRHDQVQVVVSSSSERTTATTELSTELEQCRRLQESVKMLRNVSVIALKSNCQVEQDDDDEEEDENESVDASVQDYDSDDGSTACQVFAQGQFDDDGEWVEDVVRTTRFVPSYGDDSDDDNSEEDSTPTTGSGRWDVLLSSTMQQGGWKPSSEFLRRRDFDLDHEFFVTIGGYVRLKVSSLSYDPKPYYNRDRQSSQVTFEEKYDVYDDEEGKRRRVRLVASLAPMTMEQHEELREGNFKSVFEKDSNTSLTFLRLEFPLEESGWNADRFLRFPEYPFDDPSVDAEEAPTSASEQRRILPAKRKSCDVSSDPVVITRELARRVAETMHKKTILDMQEENKCLQVTLKEMLGVSIADCSEEDVVIFAHGQLKDGESVVLEQSKDPTQSRIPVAPMMSAPRIRLRCFWSVNLDSRIPSKLNVLPLLSIRVGEFLVISVGSTAYIDIADRYDEDTKTVRLSFTGFDGNNNMILYGRLGPITKAEYVAFKDRDFRESNWYDDLKHPIDFPHVFADMDDHVGLEFDEIKFRNDHEDKSTVGWIVQGLED